MECVQSLFVVVWCALLEKKFEGVLGDYAS